MYAHPSKDLKIGFSHFLCLDKVKLTQVVKKRIYFHVKWIMEDPNTSFQSSRQAGEGPK